MVIAIIALLIGILLPALGAARESAMTLGCAVNLRSVGQATHLYANDNRDHIWPRRTWIRVVAGTNEYQPNADEYEPGIFFDYVASADDVLACAKNQRQGTGLVDPSETSELFDDRPYVEVDTDYCFTRGMQGARLDNQARLAYVNRIGGVTGAVGLVQNADFDQKLKLFKQLPIFVEESTWINNGTGEGDHTDADWSNQDQITERHNDRGHLLNMDTTVTLFEHTYGNPEIAEQGIDFTGYDIFVKVFFNGDDVWLPMMSDTTTADGTPRVLDWGWLQSYQR